MLSELCQRKRLAIDLDTFAAFLLEHVSAPKLK